MATDQVSLDEGMLQEDRFLGGVFVEALMFNGMSSKQEIKLSLTSSLYFSIIETQW